MKLPKCYRRRRIVLLDYPKIVRLSRTVAEEAERRGFVHLGYQGFGGGAGNVFNSSGIY